RRALVDLDVLDAEIVLAPYDQLRRSDAQETAPWREAQASQLLAVTRDCIPYLTGTRGVLADPEDAGWIALQFQHRREHGGEWHHLPRAPPDRLEHALTHEFLGDRRREPGLAVLRADRQRWTHDGHPSSLPSVQIEELDVRLPGVPDGDQTVREDGPAGLWCEGFADRQGRRTGRFQTDLVGRGRVSEDGVSRRARHAHDRPGTVQRPERPEDRVTADEEESIRPVPHAPHLDEPAVVAVADELAMTEVEHDDSAIRPRQVHGRRQLGRPAAFAAPAPVSRRAEDVHRGRRIGQDGERVAPRCSRLHTDQDLRVYVPVRPQQPRYVLRRCCGREQQAEQHGRNQDRASNGGPPRSGPSQGRHDCAADRPVGTSVNPLTRRVVRRRAVRAPVTRLRPCEKRGNPESRGSRSHRGEYFRRTSDPSSSRTSAPMPTDGSITWRRPRAAARPSPELLSMITS